MKIPLKTKIAYWWWKKFRFKDPVNRVQKISIKSDGIKSLLFLLPQDRTHLLITLHFLKTLIARGHYKSINKIIGWNEDKDIINPELLKRTRFITKNEVNSYGLLTSEALKQLTKGRFKAVINLDPEVNPISTQIVSSFNAEIRIGFNSDSTKDIYNINIEKEHGNNYVEKGYKYILEVLGL